MLYIIWAFWFTITYSIFVNTNPPSFTATTSHSRRMQAPVEFLDLLPTELLMFIAAFLRDRDRRRLERTGKRFRQLMRSFPELQPQTLVFPPDEPLAALPAYLDSQPYTRRNLALCDLRGAGCYTVLYFDTISKELAQCPNLRTLWLGALPGSGPAPPFASPGQLGLTDYIPPGQRTNALWDLPARTSTTGLHRLQQLTALDLGGRLRPCPVDVFSADLFPNLKTLSIRGCHVPEHFLQGVARTIKWCHLSVVDVRGTALDLNAQHIATSIGAIGRRNGKTLRVVCNCFSCQHKDRTGDTWVCTSTPFPLVTGGAFIMDCVSECQNKICTKHRKSLLNLWG